MRVLFYVEPLTERDAPMWKRAWVDFVRMMIDALKVQGAHPDCACIVGDGLHDYATEHLAGCRLSVINHTELVPRFGSSALEVASRWYKGADQAAVQQMARLVRERLTDFTPEVCISFSPAPFLKAAFAVPVLHFEHGMVSRAPFPATAYLDAQGMFMSGTFAQAAGEFRTALVSSDEAAVCASARRIVDAIAQINPLAQAITQRLHGYTRTVLVALQFSQYYAYDVHGAFADQYDLIVQTLTRVPANVAVMAVEHPQYPVLSADTLHYLQHRFPNFIWSPEFRRYAGTAQYLMQFCQVVVTVSSSVGLQTLLWKRALIVAGHSHLDAIADSHDLADCARIGVDQPWPIWKEAALAWQLTRYTIPFDLLFGTAGCLAERVRTALAPDPSAQPSVFAATDAIVDLYSRAAQKIIAEHASDIGGTALQAANTPPEAMIDSAHARERALAHALSLREAAYNDRIAEIEGLQKHIRELTELLSQSQRRNDHNDMNAYRREIEAITAEVQHLRTELKTRSSTLDQLEFSYVDRIREVENLSTQNIYLRNEIEQLSISRLHISDERDAALRELDRAATHSALLTTELTTLNARVAALNDALALKDAARANSLRDVAASNEQIARLTQTVDSLRQTNVALKDDLGNSQRALQALQTEIGRLLASRSWRLTRPLRVIGRLSRGEWPLVRSVIASRLRSIARRTRPVPMVNSVQPPPEADAALRVEPNVDTAATSQTPAKHRILLVSYYCPTRAHAGGLRILDIYSLIRDRCPHAQLDLYTHHRPSIDWSLDDVHQIFDHVYLSPIEDLSLSGLAALTGAQSTYDVVDLQFHQSAYHLDAFRTIAKKVVFTPMESLTKVLFIDLRNRANSQGKSGVFKMATSLRLASEEVTFSVKADEVICVSRADAAFLRAVTGSRHIKGLDTGVSRFEFSDALNPKHVLRTAESKECRLLYVAYFGSETNVTALRWYLDNVHPLVKAQVPGYVLSVVGRGDLSSFKKYRDDSIEFVGEVPSIAPHIENARVGIAPALGGSGFRGKVNQYAVLGVPSVVSSIAFKGLAYQDGVSIFIADAPETFAQRCIQLLTDFDLNRRMSEAARAVCMERYSWQSKWKAISGIYKLGDAP